MGLPTEVQLSINITPKFPRRCIVCGEPGPETTVGVGDLMIGWFSFLTDIPEGWGHVVVPVHTRCRRPFRLRRWLSRILGYTAVGVLLWFFGRQIEAMFPTLFRHIGLKVSLMIMLLPLVVLEMLFFPAQFDITVTKYYVTFQFADPRFAAAFAKCNNEMRRYEEIKRELPYGTDC